MEQTIRVWTKYTTPEEFLSFALAVDKARQLAVKYSCEALVTLDKEKADGECISSIKVAIIRGSKMGEVK